MAATEALTDMNDDFLLYSITERFLKEAEWRNRSLETTLEFAWCMVRSPKVDDIHRGLDLIRRLFECHSRPIDDIQVLKRSYYILAVGNARLKNYQEAFRVINSLRQVDPSDPNWNELKKAIVNQRVKGSINGKIIAGAGVGIVVVGIVAALAFRLLMK